MRKDKPCKGNEGEVVRARYSFIWERSHDVLSGSGGWRDLRGGGGHDKNVALKGEKGG